MRHIFKSVFSEEITNYLNEKKAAGFKEKTYRSKLITFDKFCLEEKIETPTFTEENAKEWIKQREYESHITHYGRLNTIKNFLNYLSLKGYEIYIYKDIKFKGTNFVPHIYTETEISKYFYAVDQYSSSTNRKDAIQFPILFRILYCCGTRINETLGIRKKDVDLINGIIQLNETKNNNQRYVVLGDDLLILLKKFADKCFYMMDEDDYIFTNRSGRRIQSDYIYEKHREFLKEAGIPYLGNHLGPRIHDWRHTMAVYSLKKLIDSGLDMYVSLPILSAYLGHKSIYATEKYVRLTLQLFPYIEEKFKTKIDYIFANNLTIEDE